MKTHIEEPMIAAVSDVSRGNTVRRTTDFRIFKKKAGGPFLDSDSVRKSHGYWAAEVNVLKEAVELLRIMHGRVVAPNLSHPRARAIDQACRNYHGTDYYEYMTKTLEVEEFRPFNLLRREIELLWEAVALAKVGKDGPFMPTLEDLWAQRLDAACREFHGTTYPQFVKHTLGMAIERAGRKEKELSAEKQKAKELKRAKKLALRKYGIVLREGPSTLKREDDLSDVELVLACRNANGQTRENLLCRVYERTEEAIKSIAGKILKNRRGGSVQVTFEDLVGAGKIGFMKAIESFDPEIARTKNASFKTYASRRILGEMLDYLRASSFERIQLSKKTWREIKEKSDVEDRVMKEGGKRDAAMIAEEMGISADRVRELDKVEAMLNCISLDKESGPPDEEGGGSSLKDTVADKRPNPAELFERKELNREVLGAINSVLTEQERAVVEKYYWEEKTGKQIGEELGVTESRVRQLLYKAGIVIGLALEGKPIERPKRPPGYWRDFRNLFDDAERCIIVEADGKQVMPKSYDRRVTALKAACMNVYGFGYREFVEDVMGLTIQHR